jgi:acetolactate synthase-1/2/3 large subunit
MTTLMGKSAFPEDHPLALGTGGHSGVGPAGDFLRRADLIVGIGCSFSASLFAAPIPPGKRIVHITNHEGDLSKDLAADCVVLGDAKLVLQQMLAEIGEDAGGSGAVYRDGQDARDRNRPDQDRHPVHPVHPVNARGGSERLNALAKEVQAARKAWRAQWQPKLTSAETPINPYRVIHELMQVADRERMIVTHDSGTPRDQLSPFWESRTPRGYLGWGKSTQLGSSLGFAMGAKLACPEKWVVQFLGDTALGMCGMDLETAVRERIPILTLLVNNGLMGGYERHIPVASARYRSRYLSGDYQQVAQGLGVVTQGVADPAAIRPALERALAVTAPGGDPASPEARPALIEFITREETELSRPW